MSQVSLQNPTTSSSGSVRAPDGCSTNTHSKSVVVVTAGRAVGRSLSFMGELELLPSTLASFSAESTYNADNINRQLIVFMY